MPASPLTLQTKEYRGRFCVGREETVRPLGVEELAVLGGTSSGEERGGQHLENISEILF